MQSKDQAIVWVAGMIVVAVLILLLVREYSDVQKEAFKNGYEQGGITGHTWKKAQ